VIPPTIDAARYRVRSDRGAVVFINPVAEKGLDRAIGIAAACPDIPFLFVESWTLVARGAVQPEVPHRAPPQHHLLERREDDVRDVYARARFLLAPSLWREAWGRVASEAQCSGLPVIGSDRGGLPEAIGPGGVVIPAEAELAGWVAAVRRLWSDGAITTRCRRALLHAERPEIEPRGAVPRPSSTWSPAHASREGRRAMTGRPMPAAHGGHHPLLPARSRHPRPRARQRARAGACRAGCRSMSTWPMTAPPAGAARSLDTDGVTLLRTGQCRARGGAQRRARPGLGRWRRGGRGVSRFRRHLAPDPSGRRHRGAGSRV
jgi:hypothetical protein